MEQQYKKYSQLIQGQFKKTSKKAQALLSAGRTRRCGPAWRKRRTS